MCSSANSGESSLRSSQHTCTASSRSSLSRLGHEAEVLLREVHQVRQDHRQIGRSVTPIHFAIVAAYCSTDVVGINRPLPASVDTFGVKSGNAP